MGRLTAEKLLPAYEIVMQIFSSVESKIGAIYLIRTLRSLFPGAMQNTSVCKVNAIILCLF